MRRAQGRRACRGLGLDVGADDYLVKPFAVQELLARLRGVARRQGGQAAPVLTNGRVSLDPATREASHGDDTTVLSAREFALLHALLLRPGRILSRAELESHLYGWSEEVESNAVDFIIHGVRKKLAPHPGEKAKRGDVQVPETTRRSGRRHLSWSAAPWSTVESPPCDRGDLPAMVPPGG